MEQIKEDSQKAKSFYIFLSKLLLNSCHFFLGEKEPQRE